MAKFITTTEISWQIEKIIGEAKMMVVIVSPYLSIHNRLEQIIERQLNQRIAFYFVYREENLKSQTKSLFERMNSKNKQTFHLIKKSNIHGKCYMNESSALITSMNLHEYSMVNNIEYGILLEKESDENNYHAITDNVLSLFSEKSKSDLLYRIKLSLADL